jgi:hypothetical protein
MAVTKAASDWTSVGYGVEARMDGNYLLLRVATTAEARKAAPMSKTGKTRLLGSTGGFQKLIGSDLKVSTIVTLPVGA